MDSAHDILDSHDDLAGEAASSAEPVALTPVVPAHRSRFTVRINDLYELTKPRMNFLVVVTTLVGYDLASRQVGMNWIRLTHTLLGTFLCASAAGILNQLIERRYDALMPRTKNRPLPTGRIRPQQALIFGILCGVIGVSYLATQVNALTAALGAFTLLSYIGVYTPLKRRTTLNTVIGAIPGAIPPVMGFTAVNNSFSAQAVALFLILFVWQMPHFLAIAILYKNDYAAGGFKMLPNVNEDVTARQMIFYAMALIPVSLTPVLLGMAGAVYFAAATLLGLMFLACAIRCALQRTRLSARQLFFASIILSPRAAHNSGGESDLSMCGNSIRDLAPCLFAFPSVPPCLRAFVPRIEHVVYCRM